MHQEHLNMPRKSKQELREELIEKILKEDRATRKLVKLDKSKGYYIDRAQYYWPDTTVPVVGQVLEPGVRLRTAAGVKGAVTSDQDWLLNLHEADEDLPLLSREVNNFSDAIVVEVELRVTRVFRAHDLKEILVKPETPIKETKINEDWNTING